MTPDPTPISTDLPWIKRLFSPFRLRLYLSLPLVFCLPVWLACWASSPERRPDLTWKYEYGPPYIMNQTFELAEFKRRIASMHVRSIELPGFFLEEVHTDASAPPPWTSMMISRTVTVRFGVVTLLSGLPITFYFIFTHKRRRARNRLRRGLCPNCAYDLRAHAPGQICPECGTPILPQASSHPN